MRHLHASIAPVVERLFLSKSLRLISVRSNMHSTTMSIVFTFSAALISYIFYYVFIHRLSRYPGPLLAKITNIWRLINVRKGSYQETLRDLHRQYGSVVRIGPNLLYVCQLLEVAAGLGDTSLRSKRYGYCPQVTKRLSSCLHQ